MTSNGHVSFLALSARTYADLKENKETPLVFTGPESPVSVKKVGEEDLTTRINERPTTVHTIKVQGSAGGTFWVLDDPTLPMLIKGEYKANENGQIARWIVTSIADQAFTDRQVVSELSRSGEATTHAILFAYNSANLNPEAKPVLDSVAQYLHAHPQVRLEIQGHTDNIGGPDFNLDLSLRRANSVKLYIVSGGIDAGRLAARGYGLTVPVADNATPQGRADNRRVVFVVQ
jgi:outer membrane protein OmpA-like peptidoglycan-associated protein